MTHATIYRILKESRILISHQNLALFVLPNGRVVIRPETATVTSTQWKCVSITSPSEPQAD